MQKERIVNTLIKIFKGDIEFTEICAWIKFRHGDRKFFVDCESLLAEEYDGEHIVGSNEYTNVLTNKLRKELYG